MFGKRFGRGRPRAVPRDVSALARGLSVPAARAARTPGPARSHLGGVPELPSAAWPAHHGGRLDFLARVELGELQSAAPIEWLPRAGALLFFYDAQAQPWGYDPGDRGRWAVMYVAEDADSRATPGADGLCAEAALPRASLAFRRIESYPSCEREPVVALGLTDGERDAYLALRDAPFQRAPQHQLGGFPSPLQGDDMELQCQLVSHGLYCGDQSGYQDPRAAGLRAGAADWRLLLQLDSDDDLGVMWGDAGMIYFWIREPDARVRAFERAWLVLQCA